MATICVLGVPHHNSDSPNNSVGVIDVPDGVNPQYAGLVAVWESGGCDPTFSTYGYEPPTYQQYQQLMADGRLFLAPHLLEEEGEEDSEDQSGVLFYTGEDGHVLWVQASGPDDKWGDKWTATHVHVQPWSSNTAEVADLVSKHTPEELAVLLLRERSR